MSQSNWYLKGSFNDWHASPAYELILHDSDKPSGTVHQYILTVTLHKDDALKFHFVTNDAWYGIDSFEDGGAKGNFYKDNTSGNTIVNVDGKYRFFLKEYSNNYYQIYVSYVSALVDHSSGFGIITLNNNVLTIDGIQYALDGTTTGSETDGKSFKEISLGINEQMQIVLKVGDAIFVGEDYSIASNFILADDNQLETADGYLFSVEETSILYSITPTITNGSYSGDISIAEDSTATVNIIPNTGYVIPATVTVTGADYTYSNGVVSLSNPTDDITITATCLEQLQAPYIELYEEPSSGYSNIHIKKIHNEATAGYKANDGSLTTLTYNTAVTLDDIEKLEIYINNYGEAPGFQEIYIDSSGFVNSNGDIANLDMSDERAVDESWLDITEYLQNGCYISIYPLD